MNLRDIPGHPREQASKPLGGAHAKEPLTAPGRSATSCEEQGTLKIGESYLRGLNIPQGAFTLMSLILMLKPIRRVGPLAFGLPTRFRIPPTLNTIRIICINKMDRASYTDHFSLVSNIVRTVCLLKALY